MKKNLRYFVMALCAMLGVNSVNAAVVTTRSSHYSDVEVETNFTPAWDAAKGDYDNTVLGPNGLQMCCDGDKSTYFWGATTPGNGIYLMFTFDNAVDLNAVEMFSDSPTDYPGSNWELQLSADHGASWMTISALENYSTNAFTLNAKGVTNVRFFCTAGQDTWVKFHEVTLDYTVAAGIDAVTTESISAPSYNILGQKVAAQTKGLVIKNGRKFISK